MNNICVVPGSFDPFTNGHLDVVERAAKIFDEVIVSIFVNSQKKYMFSPDDKLQMIQAACKSSAYSEKLKVEVTDKLVADFVMSKGAKVIIKGARDTSDYNYEYKLFLINKEIGGSVETFLLPSKNENLFISSTFVRELITYNKDISKYVPKAVNDYIITIRNTLPHTH